MKLFSFRWLAQWIPIRKAIDRAVPHFEKVLIAGFEAGPAAVSLRALETAVAARDFRAVDVAIGPGIAAIQRELLDTVPGELLRSLIAGADTESENPTRALAAAPLTKSKVGIRFDVTNPRATMWAEMRSAALVREVTKAQRETIRKVLGDAYKAGMGTRPTAALLRGVLPLDSRRAAIAQRAFEQGGEAAMKKEIAKQVAARAKVIARTEISTATNEGQRMMWQEKVKAGLLPKNMERVWITTPDDRLCPICAPLDGTRAPLDGDFPSGHAGPPAHPQCRCAQGLEQAALSGPNAGQTLGPGVPQASPAKKAKTPAQKVMDEVGLPNLSIAPPNPTAAADDPDWDIVNDPQKAWQGRLSITQLQKELFSTHGIDVVLPSTGLDHTTVEGRMVISGVLTSMRLAKSSKEVLVKSGLITNNQSLPYEMRFTTNPTQGAAFLYADTTYTPAGNVKSQAIVVNLASPAWTNLTSLKSALKVNHEAGFLAGESPESVFIHELGHLHHAQNAPSIQKAAAAFWEDPGKKQLAGYVSKYAATKPVEFVAEVYAGMAEGTQYSSEVMSLYTSLGGVLPKGGGSKSGMSASTVSQAQPAITVKAPNIKAPIPQGPEGDIVKKVLELKKQGLSYNKIEAAMGWPPQKGFKAFAIVKKYGDSANAKGESPTAAPVKGEGIGSAIKAPEPPKPATPPAPTGPGASKATSMFNAVKAKGDFEDQYATFKPKSAHDVASHKDEFNATVDAIIAKFKSQGYAVKSNVLGPKAMQDVLFEGPDGSFKLSTKSLKVEFNPALSSAWNNQSQYEIKVSKVSKAAVTQPPIPAIAAPSAPPAANQPSPAFFDELLKTKISGAKGSNAGGVYSINGEQYYAKFYKEPAQGKGEHLANSIYNKLGLKTPESVIGQDSTGQQIYASKWMKGLKGTAAQEGYDGAQANKFMDGFLADVFTANWDAVGTGLDNFGFTDTGDIVRLDQGGTFLFRAQAGKKPAELLNKITEWDSFFQKNPYYAKVAAKAGINKAEDLGGNRLNQQLNQLKMLVPDWQKKESWRKFVDDHAASMSESDKQQVAEMLATRIKLIDQKVQAAAGIPPKPIPVAAPVATPVASPAATTVGVPTPDPWTHPSKQPVPMTPTKPSGSQIAALPPLPKSTKNNPTSYVSDANHKLITKLTQQGYSVKQIAEHTGVTGAAVKKVAELVGGSKMGTVGHGQPQQQVKPQVTGELIPGYGNLEVKKSKWGSSQATVKMEVQGQPTFTTVYQYQLDQIKSATAKGALLDDLTDILDGVAFPGDPEEFVVHLLTQMGITPPKSGSNSFVQHKGPGAIPTSSEARKSMPRPPYEEAVVNAKYKPYIDALTWDQRNAVTRYTGSYYSEVNKYLRRGGQLGDKSNAHGENARLIQSAVSNGPKPPPPSLVYRTQGLSKKMEAALQPGAEVQMNGFQSATVKQDLNFGGGKALFEIIPNAGTWVQPISLHAREKEFLLPHALRYRVLSVRREGGKIIYRVEMI